MSGQSIDRCYALSAWGMIGDRPGLIHGVIYGPLQVRFYVACGEENHTGLRPSRPQPVTCDRCRAEIVRLRLEGHLTDAYGGPL